MDDLHAIVAEDFDDILADGGIAGTLEFPRSGTAARAMIAETTVSVPAELGGVRVKRTFAATLRASDFAAAPDAFPRCGEIVRFDGADFRLSQIRRRSSASIFELEFCEK